MLKSLNHLCGYRIDAIDDTLGSVKDFLFDDVRWMVRYMEVDTGTWLPGQRVLIAPQNIGEPDWAHQTLPVDLSKQRIKDSPSIYDHQPVSRQHEIQLVDYYNWVPYWDMGIAGDEPIPDAVPGGKTGEEAAATRQAAAATRQTEHDSHLRSVKEVNSYHIRASDDEIGHVEDVIADTANWIIRYLVVDTRNWLPGRKVLLAPDWCDRIDWQSRSVHVDLTRQQVRDSPEYHPDDPVNRELEVRLYDYYGRPVYW